MFPTKALLFTLVILSFSSYQIVQASDELTELYLKWDSPIESLRWADEGTKSNNAMVSMRQAALSRNWTDCYEAAEKAYKVNSQLQGWIAKAELECLAVASGAKSKSIEESFKRAEAALKLEGPWQKDLLRAIKDLSLQYLSHPEVTIASGARKRLLQNSSVYNALTNKNKAKLFDALGDEFSKKNKAEEARYYYEQSLALEQSSDVLNKLGKLQRKLGVEPTSVGEAIASKYPPDKEHEKKYQEIQSEQKKKRFVQGAEKALAFLKSYPGSLYRDELRSLVLRNYTSLESNQRKSLLKKMADAEKELAQKWARELSSRSDYSAAAELLASALEKSSDLDYDPKSYITLARRFHWAGNYSEAIKYFDFVRSRSIGQPPYIEATYYKAISELRLKKYQDALKSFDEVLAIGGSEAEPYEMSSLYWAYRANELNGQPGRESYYQKLMESYPLTYFSFLIHAERNDGQLMWTVPKSESRPEAKFYLLPSEKAGWERVQALLAVGWHDEAWLELQALPSATTPEQKILIAKHMAAAMIYPPAIRMLNQAWDEDTKWRNQEIVKLAYPYEFQKEIKAAAEENKLQPVLVTSLIRQESAFYVPALSSSNAIGLMQLIPPTAREVLGWMGLSQRYKVPDDIYQPSLNLRLGSRYLRHVSKQFNHNIPIALASYNAGPTRMRRWLNARDVTASLAEKEDWQPIDDLWVDELPWGEPRFYVKAILRNTIIYQLLESEKAKLETPVWKGFSQP